MNLNNINNLGAPRSSSVRLIDHNLNTISSNRSISPAIRRSISPGSRNPPPLPKTGIIGAKIDSGLRRHFTDPVAPKPPPMMPKTISLKRAQSDVEGKESMGQLTRADNWPGVQRPDNNATTNRSTKVDDDIFQTLRTLLPQHSDTHIPHPPPRQSIGQNGDPLLSEASILSSHEKTQLAVNMANNLNNIQGDIPP